MQTLHQAAEQLAFTQTSDAAIGQLLTALAASKPGGRFLDLGTGVGHSISHLLAGATTETHVVSIDNDAELQAVARAHFGNDKRVEIIHADGGPWLQNYTGPKFDLVFADTWPGKFWDLEPALNLVQPGGFYLVDDLKPHDDWPEGHAERVQELTKTLLNHPDFRAVRLDWSTGLILLTKCTAPFRAAVAKPAP